VWIESANKSLPLTGPKMSHLSPPPSLRRERQRSATGSARAGALA